MSEAQRYSKSGREGWDPNQGQGNKGEKKQLDWINKLRDIADSSSSMRPSVKRIVDVVMQHENIPRKKPKFMNFLKNVAKWAHPRDVDETWNLFSQALQQPTPQPQPKVEPKPVETNNTITEDNSTQVKEAVETKKEKKKKKKKGKENAEEAAMETTEPVPEPAKKQKKGKKRKHEEDNLNETANGADDTMEVDNEPAAKKTKFDWDVIIQAVLSKKGNQMKLKKLKKKCVSEYFVQNPSAHQTPEQIGVKFDKKINKRQKYKVLGDEVHLVVEQNEENTKQDKNDNATTNGTALTNGTANTNRTAHTNGTSCKPDKKENGSATNGLSFNAWEGANLGSDAQTEKFRRLMGIKAAPKPQELAGVLKKRDDRAIFRDLEHGFKQARNTHFKEKGMGLGFASNE